MVFQTTSASPTNLNETHFADDVSFYSVTEWQRPIYSVIDGICIVDGIVAVDRWGERSTHLLTLPSDCRPSKQIAFSLNHGEKQARVDVYPDGKVVVKAGGKIHGWMMLSGMHFQTTSARPTNSLTNFTGVSIYYVTEWQDPIYSVIDGICIVDGMVSVVSWGHLLTLPPDCRPSKRIIFSLNNNANPARVDVFSDGRVGWAAGGRDHGWLSLSGMMFHTYAHPPRVSIANPMNVAFDKEVDFAIRVSHDSCGNDCFARDSFRTNVNTELKCEVYVGKSNSTCVDSHSGVGGDDISSCLRWDNFFDD